ncbi:MAG TPA: BamA/TamA family outer membrane protein, partial [Chitinophagaceae bacterium]
MIKYSAVLLLAVFASGCAITFVKKAPKDKPFVYETNVKVQNAANNAERNQLEERLVNQLDDSLRARRKDYPLWKTISKPPAFDTINIERTKAYMAATMKSLGYFSATILDTYSIKKVTPFAIFNKADSQLRTTIDFTIIPGKNLKIDSVGFALTTPEWQDLVVKHQGATTLKKNGPYSKGAVAQELDRIIILLRNNGYYKVTKEDIYAEVDTVVEALIDPTLDPFEQLQLLEQLKQRNQTPTIDVIIKQRPIKDSAHVRPYFIRKVTIYPDVPVAVDTFQVIRQDTFRMGDFYIVTRSDKFHRRFLPQYSALRPGDMYRQDNYFRTINTFNQLGAWQQANVDVFESLDNDSTLDVEVTLYPAKKYTSNLDLELSRNNANTASSDLVAVSNLFGLGFNVGVRNRNFSKQSVQTTTNARIGFELGKNVFQTVQTSASHNIYFPKIHSPRFLPPKKRDSMDLARTFIATSVGYTDRKDFFQLFSANVGFGWEWARGNHAWLFRIANLEFANLTESDSLERLQRKNPYLKYAFNDGLVSSTQLSYRWQKPIGNHVNSVRIGFEQSGGGWGNIKKIDINGKLFRYVRIDGDYRHWIQYKKSALAFRFFGAYGVAYGDSSSSVKEKSMPFFKQYVAGGPNSMRAWQVRQLGWGSNIPTDDSSFRDRFGDIQLETNVEYRFQLGTLPGGIKVGSALYVDMGNIWLRKTFGDPELKNAEFNFGRLGKDIAIGTGTGLRVDFNYFLIRLDYAYKIKDPQ